ncbi:MAG: transposase [Thermodesulfobacteriota bacterium]|nr:transposase [Thermodesulfobacteriota bacterium]
MKNNKKHVLTFAYQHSLRPELPTYFVPKEFRQFRDTLIEVNRILESGIEYQFIVQKMKALGIDQSKKAGQRFYTRTSRALRYNFLLAMEDFSHRELAVRVSDSLLLQWFTATDGLVPRPYAKSTIERFEKTFEKEEIEQLIQKVNQAVSERETAEELILQEELNLSDLWADTTCITANIHYPVDWVLLRDATRTLIKSILVIRRHGLKHRIGPPEQFITEINKAVMEMSHTRKKKDGAKRRKMILRRMKKLLKTIEAHAERYYEMLDHQWDLTDLSRKQAEVVLGRMRNVIDQLPDAIRQAHERIIGERRVNNREKILSFYEPDVRVMVRGKSGAEVEFGNALYLVENRDGLIVDWKFLNEQPPSDSALVKESIERVSGIYGKPDSYVADRGFSSKPNSEFLHEEGIYDAICPKSVHALGERLQEPRFRELQKRRAGTEARIGVFKNVYSGRPLRSKGFDYRDNRIGWCILAHNLWKLASIAADNRANQDDCRRLIA